MVRIGVVALSTLLASGLWVDPGWCQPASAQRNEEDPEGELDSGALAIILPTTLVQRGKLEPPGSADPALSHLAKQLDEFVTEAVLDLGLELAARDQKPTELDDDELVARAERGRWVVSPRLERQGKLFRLEIRVVSPGSRVILLRSRLVRRSEFEVRTAVMLREIADVAKPDESEQVGPGSGNPVQAPRSAGRAVLALNSAALGGYVGLSLQRASGSNDARLTYPLVALGTGIGLGASLIVADEWDVGVGASWYLTAGAWWPASAGLLLASGYDVEPVEDRYVYGLVGAAGGMTLAATALAFTPIDHGDAALTHSGGAVGLLLGALAQASYEGDTEATPTLGMGYGAGAGVVLAGLLATRLEVDTSRVLFIDMAAGLGALTGAAAASPLVFDEVDETKNRTWLGAVAAGTLIGGALGYLWTEPSSPSSRSSARPGRPSLLPYATSPRELQRRWAAGERSGLASPEREALSGFELGLAGTW